MNTLRDVSCFTSNLRDSDLSGIMKDVTMTLHARKTDRILQAAGRSPSALVTKAGEA